MFGNASKKLMDNAAMKNRVNGTLFYPSQKYPNDNHVLRYLPTIICSRTEHFFLIRFQMSIVNSVEAELNMESRSDIRAATITAIIRPRNPAEWKKEDPGFSEIQDFPDRGGQPQIGNANLLLCPMFPKTA